MTSIQRAGSFVNANVHFHTLVPEGVWYERSDGAVAFHALPPPTDEDVLTLAERIVRRVARLLRARDADADATDPPSSLTWCTRRPRPLRCDDHLRVLAFITDPTLTTTILDHLGALRAAAPRARPLAARPGGELDLGC